MAKPEYQSGSESNILKRHVDQIKEYSSTGLLQNRFESTKSQDT